jgi:hypothetical protein
MENYFRIGKGRDATLVFFDDATIEGARAAWTYVRIAIDKNPFVPIGVWRDLPYEGPWRRRAVVIAGESMRYAGTVS